MSAAPQSGGYSFLYADTFLTEPELREMFDHTLYDQVRRLDARCTFF